MKTASILLATFALTFAFPPGFAQDHAHGDHTGPLQLELDNGEKWQTDEPLRTAMSDIRETFDTALPELHDETLDATGYDALARSVEDNVQYMVENCALPPAADAQLHVLIGELMQGAASMRDDADPHAGAMQVVQALDAYERHFVHPGWKPLH